MRTHVIALALLAGSVFAAATAHAQSVSPAPGFTYQGRLDDGTLPANGNYQFYFELYAAPTGGSALASVNTAASPATLAVNNGLFLASLDFGAAVYNGNERYLQVYVRSGSSGPFTALASRQRLSPTPYANFSSNTRGMFVDTTGRFQFGPYATSYRGIIGDAAQGELLELRSNNSNFTLMTLVNQSSGGRPWALLSTGATYSTGAGDLVFRDIGTASDRFVLGSDGNVGIGALTLNPASYGRTLTINGTPNVGGGSASTVYNNPQLSQQWNAGIGAAGVFYFDKFGGGSNVVSVPVLEIRGGSDIAEPYNVEPAADVAPIPGMVVVIDETKIGSLKLATKAYDHAVAGIISGANGVNTGLTLTQKGSQADGQLPIANVGRVWCYVDADANGAVHAGDLLTTSGTPGYAMRAEAGAANGAVLGKAMSNLESGKGMVLVLVGLQ
ncbi:MAG: hypothetical protein WC718_14880 [Phycisphaerales bacterium]|jgi:hypothetical protein